MNLYVERFNRRDWDGVRELISADARLVVADRFAGRLADAPYFNYERLPLQWKLAVGELDDEPVVIILRPATDAWIPHSVVRLDVTHGRIDSVKDYVHCPWVISTAASVTVATQPWL